MKTYPKMKDSGIAWIEKIPKHWNIKRLKFTTKFDLSTVDRHEDHEFQVSICHYPQVYNNEKITDLTELSSGTCTKKEIEKFRLKKDDVLITKDSETPDDIGVPAYVVDDLANTVCGYHVAQLTTNKKELLGIFLFRFIQSDIVNAYFETESNGVTRFGLGKGSIANLNIVIPSITEQNSISYFIDKAISKVDLEISKNQKLIELLKEKRQNLINFAVTKGLDPTVSMKDSGIDWIGKIPEHWSTKKITASCELRGRIGWKGLTTDDYRDVGPILLGVSNISKFFELDLTKLTRISEEGFRESPEIIVQENDILLAKSGATTGKVCIVRQVTEPTTVNSAVNIIRCVDMNFNPQFVYWFLSSSIMQEALISYASTSAQPNLFQRDIRKLNIIMPSYDEQKEILQYLNKQTSKIDSLISKTLSLIETLQEFRQSLISSAVTGKIDVRQEIVA